MIDSRTNRVDFAGDPVTLPLASPVFLLFIPVMHFQLYSSVSYCSLDGSTITQME